MKLYTLTFAFHDKYVLLIRKAKPDWQAGLLNGIGGKVEFGEGILQATRREFYEETGLPPSAPHPFRIFHAMMWPEYKTHNDWPLMYCSAVEITLEEMQRAVTNTMVREEPCIMAPIAKLEQVGPMMGNVPFLLKMAEYMTRCTEEERELRQPVILCASQYITAIHEGSFQYLGG